MTSYLPNIMQAIQQRESLSQAQLDDYQQRLNAALYRRQMQECHP